MLVGLGWTAGKVSVGLLVQQAVDRGIEADDMAALRHWAMVIAGAAVVVGSFTGLRRYLAFREARWIEADLRERLFAHIQRLHFSYHDRAQTGQLMSRANTDLNQIQAFVVMIPLTISNGVTVLAVTVILLTRNVLLTLLALGSLPFLNVLATRFSRRLHPAVMGIQQESAELAAVVEETVAGVRVVKGFGAEGVQAARLAVEADDVYDRSMEASRVRATFLPALELLPNLGLIATLGYGGHLVLDGELTLGELVAFNVYVVMLIWPLRMLGMILAQGQRAAAAAERVREVLETAPVITDAQTGVPAASDRAVRRAGRGPLRGGALRATRPSCRSCSTASTSSCLRASPSPSSEPPAPARPPSPASSRASTTSTPAESWSTASTCATCSSATCARPSGSSSRTPSCSPTSIGANIAFAEPDAPMDAIVRAARLAGAHEFIDDPARGVRHADRRARLLAVGRSAAAHRHRPGHPRRPPRADPRRRHLLGRPDQGARDPRRARRGDARIAPPS